MERLTSAQRRLQGEGAEFLVLGQLLIRHINAAKAYTNFPDWDILAFDSEKDRQARIQVKSRYASDSIGFLLKSTNFEFLVVVHLNMGLRYTKGKKFKSESDIPQFWVIPQSEVLKCIKNDKNKYGEWNMRLSMFPNNAAEFENAWHLVKENLT